MQIISDNKFQLFDFKEPVKKKINSERAYVISMFVEELNKTAGTKYKIGDVWKVQQEIKPSFVAFKLSHIKLVDLYSFLSQCRQSKSGFNRCFYGCLKTVDNRVDFIKRKKV